MDVGLSTAKKMWIHESSRRYCTGSPPDVKFTNCVSAAALRTFAAAFHQRSSDVRWTNVFCPPLSASSPHLDTMTEIGRCSHLRRREPTGFEARNLSLMSLFALILSKEHPTTRLFGNSIVRRRRVCLLPGSEHIEGYSPSLFRKFPAYSAKTHEPIRQC
jgi:hypothetical protein